MAFSVASIDRSIVMTQFDLRGFAHPLGFREKRMSSPKSLDATTWNFFAFAAKLGEEDSDSDLMIDYFNDSFEQKLKACLRFAESCGCFSQKEATKLIIEEIVRQNKEMRRQVASGERPESAYLKPLNKTNRWGSMILALAEAFEVPIEAEPEEDQVA